MGAARAGLAVAIRVGWESSNRGSSAGLATKCCFALPRLAVADRDGNSGTGPQTARDGAIRQRRDSAGRLTTDLSQSRGEAVPALCCDALPRANT
jgi:hypothetical protein